MASPAITGMGPTASPEVTGLEPMASPEITEMDPMASPAVTAMGPILRRTITALGTDRGMGTGPGMEMIHSMGTEAIPGRIRITARS